MDRLKPGMLARAKAGHDAGKVYVVLAADENFAYLTDGRIRTLDKPKKKKHKHLQPIRRMYGIDDADDAQIRSILKAYNKEEEI